MYIFFLWVLDDSVILQMIFLYAIMQDVIILRLLVGEK